MARQHIITQQTDMRPSEMMDYYVAILKDGVFFEGRRYENYSGTAVHDEVKWLAEQFPRDQGYAVQW
jgi:hypothetical protein